MMGVAAARYDPDVEAAMLAHYGVRTRDVSLRELRVLMHRLPPGVVQDPDRGEVWSDEAHLLAGVIDAINDLAYVTLMVALDPKARHQVPKPKPVTRPGPKPKTVPVRPVDQVAALAAMLGGPGV